MPPPLPDETLISAARQGDDAAFQTLMLHYQDYVFGLCLRVCRNRADAEEACQECFLNFYRHLGRWRAGGKLSNWLYTIALNQCRQLLRRRRLRQVLSLDFGEGMPAPADPRRGPAEEAEGAALRACLEGAVASLPRASRELFALRYDLDLELDEITAVSGKGPVAVRTGLHRARRQLRETLLKQGFDVTAWGLEDRGGYE
jgi:RNA polymerase sigma-70 factor (ECF subfamily)